MKKLLAWWAKQPVLVTMLSYGFIGVLLVLLALSTCKAQAATGTFTASPTTGVSPLTTTLTWNIAGADVCTKSGGWTGAATLTGSQVVTGLTAVTTFNLSCSLSAGTASVTWGAPTQNVDGTPLTNLAGYKLYWATTNAGLATATATVISNPATLAYSVTGLASGTWYFGAKAFNSLGVDSDWSNIATKTIVQTPTVFTVTVTPTTKPNPPTLVTVSQTAWNMKNGRPFKVVGTVPLNTPCGAYVTTSWGTKYYELPRDQVTPTPTNRVVGRCGASATSSWAVTVS